MQRLAIRERDAEIARVLDILHRWGIQTLGQFAALDKEEVGTRLGAIGLQLWDRAKGKNTRLLKLVPAPESFEEAFEFERMMKRAIEKAVFALQVNKRRPKRGNDERVARKKATQKEKNQEEKSERSQFCVSKM